MRVANFARQYGLALVLLVAIATSFSFSFTQSRKDARLTRAETAQVRQKAIDICVKVSNAQALTVAFVQKVSEEKGEEDREHVAAAYYAGLARGGLSLIPLAPSDEKQRAGLSRVRRKSNYYELLPGAEAIIVRGCTHHYNAD